MTKTDSHWNGADQLIEPLRNIVERVGDYDPKNSSTDFEEKLLEPLSISGGESFSAEDHRGREILELLQNAQDAAGGLYTEKNRLKGKRAVYIGISDDGLLVANTGDAFDFSEPDRRKSLRILGHSETSEETIGQFGVGLTSIRSIGEAYEVWTKAPEQDTSLESRNCWRVFCGPRTTLAAIASAIPKARESEAYHRFEKAVEGAVEEASDILDVPEDTETPNSVPLSDDQIPYFTYPVAMRSWYETRETGSKDTSKSTLRHRAYDLLRHGHEDESMSDSLPEQVSSLLSDVGSFTTAIFVDYEDEDWRTLFEAITGEQPAPSEADSAVRIENQAWFDGSDKNRVTPELLLNLGNIDRVVVERFTDDEEDGSSSIQDWKVFGRDRVEDQNKSEFPVSRHITGGSGEGAVDAVEVAVQVETSINHDHLEAPSDSNSKTYSFWDVKFDDGRMYTDYEWFTPPATEGSTADSEVYSDKNKPIDVSLLLQTKNSGTELYRPHLYYPIDGAKKQFPYCIHADFAVQQNRQSLAGGALARNCVVAAEAARLVGHLSKILASADALNSTEKAAIPWYLLPKPLSDTREGTDWPEPQEVAEKTPGEVADNEPLRALRASIYRQVRQQENVQVVSGDGTQASVASEEESDPDIVLHHNPTVLAGISALYPIACCADGELGAEDVLKRTGSVADASIPTEQTLDFLLRWLGEPDTELAPAKQNSGSKSLGDFLEPELFSNIADLEGTNRAKRIEQLVTDDGAEYDVSDQFLTLWWNILQEWSEGIDEGDVGFAITGVPSETGHAVLNATTELGEDIDDFPEKSTFVPSTEGPYLLPCDLLMQDNERNSPSSNSSTKEIQLVKIESHESGKNNQRQVLRPESEDIIAPPAETEFRLYLLTENAFKSEGGSITKAKWGTREYDGDADLYRTLLRDIADRSAGVSLPDIRFLETVYDNIEFDDTTAALDAVEGSYHSRDQVKKLASSGADNLKPRADARRVNLPSILLEDNKKATARETRFGENLLEHWLAEHIETPEEDDTTVDGDPDPREVQQLEPPVQTDGAVATLPSSIENQDGVTDSLSPSQIARQLGMLGVSVLPGVRTLMIRGDDAHPDRPVSSWNPTTWSADDNERLQELQTVLEETMLGKDYLDLLTTPPFGPGESSDHTTHCNIREFPRKEKPPGRELDNYDVLVVSWTWLTPDMLNEISAPDLTDLLGAYGSTLADSILETGWSCNYGSGNIKSIDKFIPTLLNWQLRSVIGWKDIDWFYVPDIEHLWADRDEWTLQYAVLETARSQRTAAAALPRIDPSESPISESVWDSLGVKPLDKLNATEAALRLEELIKAAAGDDFEQEIQNEDESASPPLLPGLKEIDAWQALYGRLLGKIASEIVDRGDQMNLGKLQFLDYIPVQDKDGNWVGLSRDELDKAVYYDSVESDWENRLAKLNEGQYLIQRPESRFIEAKSFKDFCELIGASKKSSQYPEIKLASTSELDADPLKETLRDSTIKYGILAAASGQEELTNYRDKYDTLTDTLRRIEPDSVGGDNSETAWQVVPLEDDEGLNLENVEQDAPSHAVAYDEQMVDLEDPVDLADLFMALFRGENKDSFKLALLGRDVEGKDDIRAELRATDVQELETDLRLSVKLLNMDVSLEQGVLDIQEETAVSELREVISNCLQGATPTSVDTKRALPDSVAEAVETMCESDSETLRECAGRLVDPSTADRTDELQTLLREKLPKESPSETQLVALERLENALSNNRYEGRLPCLNDLLPSQQAQAVAESLHELVVGMQRLDDRTKPNPSLNDLCAHDYEISWSDTVIPEGKISSLLDAGLDAAALTDVLPDDCTWFHLAWWLETSNKPPEETEPAEAILDTVDAVLGDERQTVKDRVRANIHVGRRTSSNSTYTESSNTTLFTQIGTDIDWSDSSWSPDNKLTANLLSGGGSGGEEFIQQTGDRPRVAELAILRDAYAALYETDHSIDEVKSQLDKLSKNDNYWRTEDGWDRLEEFDVENLTDPEELREDEKKFPTVAFDITEEGIVGYDVLDLTGWAVRQACEVATPSENIDLDSYLDASTLSPVPVEVKSVNSSNTSFKFSLNQYQKAYNFVTSEGNSAAVPYVLFLVEVSEHDQDIAKAKYKVEPYDIKVITCPADLRQLLPSDLSPNDNGAVIDDLILRIISGGDLIISNSSS